MWCRSGYGVSCLNGLVICVFCVKLICLFLDDMLCCLLNGKRWIRCCVLFSLFRLLIVSMLLVLSVLVNG